MSNDLDDLFSASLDANDLQEIEKDKYGTKWSSPTQNPVPESPEISIFAKRKFVESMKENCSPENSQKLSKFITDESDPQDQNIFEYSQDSLDLSSNEDISAAIEKYEKLLGTDLK